MTKTAFMGGALNFKGDKKRKSKKKKSKTKHSLKDDEGKEAVTSLDNTIEEIEELTDAEKRARKRKLEREKVELETIASKSHRERVEDFNEKLGNLTELNDIPRVRCYLYFCILLAVYFLDDTTFERIVFIPNFFFLLRCHTFCPTGECCWKRLDRVFSFPFGLVAPPTRSDRYASFLRFISNTS